MAIKTAGLSAELLAHHRAQEKLNLRDLGRGGDGVSQNFTHSLFGPGVMPWRVSPIQESFIWTSSMLRLEPVLSSSAKHIFS